MSSLDMEFSEVERLIVAKRHEAGLGVFQCQTVGEFRGNVDAKPRREGVSAQVSRATGTPS